MSSRRPEHTAPPELFYDETEARKYTSNSRMVEIQNAMAERALELLALRSEEDEGPSMILDIGCGSGLSGEVLEEHGHYWIGYDISPHMLAVAAEREIEGDVIQSDAGHGLTFRPGTFDGAISISALQWLCNEERREHNAPKRLRRLFTSLYASLKRGSRAVFQFYPENSRQIELVTQQAMKCGFTGGLVVDFPNSAKAKKIFLVLSAGSSGALPQPLTGEEGQIQNEGRRVERGRNDRGKPLKKSRVWIEAHKERDRRKGKHVRPDSKYTGRKRTKF